MGITKEMNPKTDTPRTDQELMRLYGVVDYAPHRVVPASFCRALERKITKEIAIKEARGQLLRLQEKAQGKWRTRFYNLLNNKNK